MAPKSAVPPESETGPPKVSFSAPSLAVSFACKAQVAAARANTYAAPDQWPLSLSQRAPTSAVSSERATEPAHGRPPFFPDASLAATRDARSK